ncbi:MAG: bifunctional 5,10-methylenetetrahydrofolate dehydrogenase/5,10-methenyltetrahydrofolate cyclohydrolase [Candidatus Parcubacteria bacterium]|nr:bifunctional 5,10-methylenetetrahydrofolate dehydrogenase/5,10-methenyltetrahydrofolate cyclohydrolase [Candidatus Parcubacteria bacterium]
MIINGKQIAQEIKDALKKEAATLPRKLRLDIIYAGTDPVIENFLGMKIRVGKEIGVDTIVHRLPESISQKELIAHIKSIGSDSSADGMLVQLPLPGGMDIQEILNTVPPEKDVDVLSDSALKLFSENKTDNISPVAGAFMEILQRNNVSLKSKKIVILGRGRLVGKPFAICVEREGADVTYLNSTTGDPVPHLLKADIIATGMGKPHFIKPEMIREGVIILDGGTSEKNGKIVGDADPACAEKCQIFTPVPGGIGPITVALIFKNLLNATKRRV